MALVGDAPATKPASATQPVAQVKPQAPIYGSDIAPQERGMWWKEVGECIRSGAINKETPAGLQMMVAYYTEMRRVLGIMTGKEVNTKQKKALVEQAKKQGATEIKTEIENEN